MKGALLCKAALMPVFVPNQRNTRWFQGNLGKTISRADDWSTSQPGTQLLSNPNLAYNTTSGFKLGYDCWVSVWTKHKYIAVATFKSSHKIFSISWSQDSWCKASRIIFIAALNTLICKADLLLLTVLLLLPNSKLLLWQLTSRSSRHPHNRTTPSQHI